MIKISQTKSVVIVYRATPGILLVLQFKRGRYVESQKSREIFTSHTNIYTTNYIKVYVLKNVFEDRDIIFIFLK